jgi:serine/threonine-protein kinase
VIAPGDLLHKRYRIERSIGRGGMGEVFSAVLLVPPSHRIGDPDATLLTPMADSVRVAIKVVSRAVVTDAAMARLQREAEAAARVKSPFVPELIDVGTTDEGEVFLVMERLYGETLAARLKARPVLSWEEVFLLGDDVLSGLIDAHAAGVVHRDLKPSNIFLCERTPPEMLERARVLDFGVCKLDDTPDHEKLTSTGESVGTVTYMAPEQIRGASQVTERADLYSFATVIFETLSGELPHDGAGQMAVLASKLERPAARLADVARVPIPPGLDPLLARLLARDAADRIATAREVREEWRALGPALVAPHPSGDLAAPPSTETALSTGTIAHARSSRVGLALGAFSVTVSLVALLVLMVARTAPKPPIAELSAPPEPIVSAVVVERPALPATATPPPTTAAAPETDGAPTASEEPSALPRTTPPRLLHPAGGGPANRASTKPHIADKPRY